ncbi:PHP domain-containing protein [Pectobacterium odoriferum]|uniref:Phosphatase n=1 Tax=Pectobacterium odoriferum TaxID=78398 RepID=A0ABD6VUY2_9GAMM|nr:PHP domain-containing protein [Pectobacterium odoriferum]AIU88497.1 S-adenosylmethionine tRNA ribosyltransferase [Pectobacterium odoriferum]KGA42175.1 S-adenosylmethionine tRNA ribosyltransferase [Pectobacterium odoriferum]POD95027.1 phosphatase [Pectobacterium odoriferum]POD98495.1 phosphatase [Pectobacterium odoriferum]POE04239.1 phosphatase [Pectobacterium odoriferum]
MPEDSQPISSFPLYDLHSHTTASDGLLTPTALVSRAVDMRVSVLAITDHDTTAGLDEAQQAIAQQGLPLRLIPGVEISTLWENHEIHIVGLGMDIAHPALTGLLQQQAECRQSRAEQIAARLEKNRIPDALAGAQRLATGGQITRAHFARYLIELGIAANMNQVFKKYLAKGKIGYVPPQWCTIPQAIEAIHQSGGVSVLAHPGRYDLTAKWLKRLLATFAENGGIAMEVAQCQQAPDERTQLGRYARDFNLMASQGSDFHLPCAWIELGRKLWLPADVEPVWHHPVLVD